MAPLTPNSGGRGTEGPHEPWGEQDGGSASLVRETQRHDRYRPVWRPVAEQTYRGYRLIVRENVSPAARQLVRDINTFFPERRWSFVPSPRGWYVFCAIADAPEPLVDLLITR